RWSRRTSRTRGTTYCSVARYPCSRDFALSVVASGASCERRVCISSIFDRAVASTADRHHRAWSARRTCLSTGGLARHTALVFHGSCGLRRTLVRSRPVFETPREPHGAGESTKAGGQARRRGIAAQDSRSALETGPRRECLCASSVSSRG